MAKSKHGISVKSLMTGGAVANELFIKRLPVVLFGAALMMFYIAIGFNVQAKHSQMDRISAEIKELKTVSVTTSALRMELTRRETIERLLVEKKIPLVPLPSQPVIINK